MGKERYLEKVKHRKFDSKFRAFVSIVFAMGSFYVEMACAGGYLMNNSKNHGLSTILTF